jgi:outer membrane receptor protein involved in Fe transport
MRTRDLCCAGSILGTLVGISSVGHAQTPPASITEAPKLAEVSEVVVTAQRRSERIQDVPITVEAVSAETMRSAGIENVKDLSMVVPGLQIGDAVGFATPHLRGVGSTTLAPGVETPIAIYVDGVYYASTTSSLFDFVDVDNVEVLKGPQGTLFGRNATGGLIQVTTKTPTQNTHVDAEVSYGNYQAAKADLYVSGAILDNLAASFAAQASGAGEGYGRNLLTGNETNRNDINLGLRTKWVWSAADTTTLTTAADYSDRRDSFLANRLPPGAAYFPATAATPAAAAIPAQSIPAYGSPWDTAQNIDPLNRNISGGASVRLDQQLGFARLMDIVAYRKNSSTIDWDLYEGVPQYFDGLLDASESQFSEELQLSSIQGSPFIWSAGLYYFHSQSAYDPNHVIFGPPAINPLQILSPDEQHANSLAGYGQSTVEILPRTNLTLGARYTNENHNIVGHQTFFLDDGTVLSDTTHGERTARFSKATFRVALDHHLSDATMVYASFNTGFKAGGFNTGSIGDPAYGPETLNAYEVGTKTDLLERRLQLDLSGFHYDYKNIQVQKIEGAATGIINGGAAKLNGADLDLKWVATEVLNFDASAEYLNAFFTSFDQAPISGPQLGAITEVVTKSAAGKQLAYAPHLSFSIAGNYLIQLHGSELDLNATAQHSGLFFLEPDNVLQQPAYTRLNSSIEWRPSSHRYAVTLWGRNLTNEAVISYGGTLVSGLRTVGYEPPRTYGISFEYHYF